MLLLGIALGMLAGAAAGYLAGRGRVARLEREASQVPALRDERTRLATQLEADRRATAEKLALALQKMNYAHEEDLLAGIGFGHVAASTVLNRIGANGRAYFR